MISPGVRHHLLRWVGILLIGSLAAPVGCGEPGGDNLTDDLSHRCGNGVCNPSETCPSGPQDCGACPPADACAPTSCAAEGKNCGTISNGCGGTLTCGSCTAPATCGGG